METMFNDSTTAEIEARLYRDTLKHEENMNKIFIIIVLAIIFMFRGWVCYWVKFGIAIPSGTTFSQIKVMEEPIQTDYTPEEQKKKAFTYKSLVNDIKIEIIPQAHYVIQGQPVAYNHGAFFKNNF